MFTADLKLSITQAELLCLPINLITCGRSWPGGRGRSPRSLCLLQASILLTPGSQTPPGLSCLPPSSALMDVSGWMGPPWPPAFLASLQQWPPSPTPTPAGPNLRGVPRASPEVRDRVCLVSGSGNLTAGNLSHPLSPGSSGSGFPVCRRSPCPPKKGKLHFLGAYCVPNTSNALSDFIFTTAL